VHVALSTCTQPPPGRQGQLTRALAKPLLARTPTNAQCVRCHSTREHPASGALFGVPVGSLRHTSALTGPSSRASRPALGRYQLGALFIVSCPLYSIHPPISGAWGNCALLLCWRARQLFKGDPIPDFGLSPPPPPAGAFYWRPGGSGPFWGRDTSGVVNIGLAHPRRHGHHPCAAVGPNHRTRTSVPASLYARPCAVSATRARVARLRALVR
jgi:hypothetical protein